MDPNLCITDPQHSPLSEIQGPAPPSCEGQPDIPVEEQRKRIYFFFSLTIAIPILTAYGLYSAIRLTAYLDAVFNLGLAVIYLTQAILLKTTTASTAAYRIGTAGLAVMLIYCVGYGLYEESQLLWLMIFPLVVFYLFGVREAFLWIIVVMIPSAILMFFPDPFHANVYDIHFCFTLCIALMICIIFSYLLESLRARFYQQLEEQSASLRNALADVKELKGLLPICASCKSIRNDEGYWQSVEHYIITRTNVTFSHGMCNKCLKREEPEVYEKLLKAGKVRPVE